MPAVIAPPAPTGMIPAVSATSAATSGCPQQWKWTLVEYRKLGETGFFRGLKTMLIDGELLTMAMPNPPHDTTLTLAANYLRAACPVGYYVRDQQGFDIGTRTDPGPDLAVVPGSVRDYAACTPTAAVLIIEVADSSLAFDLTTKAELYATAGVPDYWVIDVEGRCLHVFRDPVTLPAGLGATAYSVHLTLAATDIVSPLAAPHATVTVADLLP